MVFFLFSSSYMLFISFSYQSSLCWFQDCAGTEIDGGFLHSESEIIRRQKFDTILKIQHENNGLIEPKKNEVLLPGMFLPPQPVALPSTESQGNSNESENKDSVVKSDTNPGSSFDRHRPRKPNHSHRKQRTQNSSKQTRHWIRRDNISEN